MNPHVFEVAGVFRKSCRSRREGIFSREVIRLAVRARLPDRRAIYDDADPGGALKDFRRGDESEA
jgi:hypothetical protein